MAVALVGEVDPVLVMERVLVRVLPALPVVVDLILMVVCAVFLVQAAPTVVENLVLVLVVTLSTVVVTLAEAPGLVLARIPIAKVKLEKYVVTQIPIVIGIPVHV